ncbi:hypothetical protein KQX54_006537 [Cotesia glomerata]|uniref:Uncharacterized protein n=1 Tax=Cotesia glomerata TaxID=32391 RepID=A0AAV7J2T9_COTGL|nr:hypothetical protein KQX54_006537 [Cotesia glomerata]
MKEKERRERVRPEWCPDARAPLPPLRSTIKVSGSEADQLDKKWTFPNTADDQARELPATRLQIPAKKEKKIIKQRKRVENDARDAPGGIILGIYTD